MGKQKTSWQFGFIAGDATLGAAIESALEDMKPGQVRIVGIWRKLLVRYSRNGMVTVIELSSGKELYRG